MKQRVYYIIEIYIIEVFFWYKVCTVIKYHTLKASIGRTERDVGDLEDNIMNGLYDYMKLAIAGPESLRNNAILWLC